MPNSCCFLCRTPFGCANRNCQHHIDERRTEDANDRARRTVRRPTEDQAIANVMRERKRRNK